MRDDFLVIWVTNCNELQTSLLFIYVISKLILNHHLKYPQAMNNQI